MAADYKSLQILELSRMYVNRAVDSNISVSFVYAAPLSGVLGALSMDHSLSPRLRVVIVVAINYTSYTTKQIYTAHYTVPYAVYIFHRVGLGGD